MKIRTDFVTNSSSSSFIVSMTIKTKNGNIEADPYREEAMECDDCFDSGFNGTLKDMLKQKTPFELYDYLNSHLYGSYSYYYDDEDDNNNNYAKIDEDDFYETIKDVSDINEIIIQRDYYAWGEFADLIADNDSTLCDFAKNFRDAKSPEEKEEILDKAFEYISNPIENLCGENFGADCDKLVYRIDSKNELEKVLQRLVTHYGPGDTEGLEVYTYDMKNKKETSVAYFDLT